MEQKTSSSIVSLPTSKNHVDMEEVSVSAQDHAEQPELKGKVTKVTVSSQDNGEVMEKVKKPTRQWAAWTHQEEDSFFAALRQVGKNFEKITARVQSKNKDQVRHYYYRLVRRMNKVLGPGLCLDAKNYKETNSAMLRWWSLLEKYSCKASKLHLKPRRFKLFAEALENQLLKDRKKVVRRRAAQGESCPIISATSASNQSKVCGPENRTVKAVLVDNQNIQKFGTSKGPSLNRNVSLGINRGNTKARTSALKTAKFQPKAGIATKAAFKRWEKAAMAAGISLVAAAAEEVERSTTAKDAGNHVQDIPAQSGFGQCIKDVPSTMNNSSGKLQLQFFPYDDATRRALESDSLNPHLELTLSGRKKISSVVEHLHRKWGHSSIACGELTLLPNGVSQPVNLADCSKWTKNSTLSAADVYSHIGMPQVFRLRYGWFSKASLSRGAENDVGASVPNEWILDATPKSILQPGQGSQQLFNTSEYLLSGHEIITVTSSTEMHGEPPKSAGTSPENNVTKSPDHGSTVMLDDNNREMTTRAIVEDQIQDDLMRDEAALVTEEWPDSPTNISVGDLLLELPNKGELDCIESAEPRNFQWFQEISQNCDSFDEAIANHILKQQRMSTGQPTVMSHTSSIWDAEDTCDAFSFQKFRNSSPGTPGEIGIPNSVASDGPKEPNPNGLLASNPTQGTDLVDNCEPHQHASDNTIKDFNGLTDIFWPDSLGPLDLDLPSCRYHSDDMILSDSLGGLNRLIASSLDAFQNCSFFGATDKKESAAAVEAGDFTSDLKISAEV